MEVYIHSLTKINNQLLDSREASKGATNKQRGRLGKLSTNHIKSIKGGTSSVLLYYVE